MELELLKEQESWIGLDDNVSLRSISENSFIFLKLSHFSQKNEAAEIPMLKGELCKLKAADENIQLKIQALDSQLSEEQSKNSQIESLLNVRGEFIASLQDADEVLKARLILQAKQLDDLRSKFEKCKKFKAAVSESLQNLKNTIAYQNNEMANLRHVLEDKEENLQMLKRKFREMGSQ